MNEDEVKPRAYYGVAARSQGVPEMWHEDAIQDMLLAGWRSNRHDAVTIRMDAIDAARRYGYVSRNGVNRGTTGMPTGMAAPDVFHVVEGLIDAASMIKKLPPNMRRALSKTYYGYGVNCQVSRARKRLREMQLAS